jgi:hypothetical protein
MQFGDLRVDVSRSPGHLRLDWRGKSNEKDPEAFLTPFLADVGHQATQDKLLLDMHFEELEFFNSSTITVVIQFVKEARAKQMRLRMSYSPLRKWQKIFFDALWMFQKPDGLIQIQAVR